MCTLVIGFQTLGPGTLIAAANRDESPDRPSDPPRLLSDSPRVAGGRDARAGGTWLAVREGRAVVAVLNRRDGAAGAGPAEAVAAGRRSRGLLALDVARVPAAASGDGLARAALDAALESLSSHPYAPFSLAFLDTGRAWLLVHDPGAPPQVLDLAPGWHVLTHADLDDRREPRTSRLLEALAGFRPAGAADAEAGLLRLMALHGGAGAAVCLHEGRMVTVSSALVILGAGARRYVHVEGRPCVSPPADVSGLL